MADQTWTDQPGGRAPRLLRGRVVRDCTIGARDGDVGRVQDLYFDDESWTVRHLVVDTGTWLPGRQVLISPRSVRSVTTDGLRVEVDLSRAQVERAPGAGSAEPVSRQREAELSRYYGYPYYWTGPYRWGPTAIPLPLPPEGAAPPGVERPEADRHLRSAVAIGGYAIRATDGELGEVEDVLVDESDWAIRYLIVDPRKWWPSAHVLLGADVITGVSWTDSVVRVDVTREQVRRAPPYEPDRTRLDRAYEAAFYGYYGRPGYWDRRPDAWRILPPAA